MLNRVQRPDIELRLFFLIATVCGFSMLVAGALKLIEVVSGTRVSWKTTAAVQSVTDSGRALVQDIEKVVQPAMRRGRIIASTDEVIEAMKHSNLDALVMHCNKAIQNSTEVDAIAFFDRDGKILAVNSIYADGKAVPQNRIQQVMRRDFSSREIITGCLKNQARRETLEFQTACDITPAFFDSSGLAVAHSVPVSEGNGDQVGVVSTRLNFERLSSMIAKRRIADGMGAIHFITDSGGYFDEKINSGGVSPLSKQDLLPRLTPLLSGTASQLAFEQSGNLYFLYRLAALETLDGGGIQAMITVPKAWGVRETALEQLLTVGGLFSLAALSLTVVGVLRLLQRTRGQKEECQRLAHIAQRTSNAVVFCDEQRRIRWVNEGFVAVTGYEKDDVVGKNISRLFGLSQSHPIGPNQLSDAIDEGLFFRGELLCRRKNGDEFWCEVEFQPLFTDGGRTQEFVVIIRDVTENSNEKRRLQSVFAAVAEGIVVQTVSGEIVDCNASAERILGLTSDQMRGRTSLDSRWKAIREDGTELPGEDHPAMVTIRTGKPQRDFVFGIHTPENITRWISVNTEPILDSSGQLSMVVTSFADITQFREQTQRLQVIVDASKIGTWDWDVQTGSAIFNDHWASMLGYEIGEMEPHVSTWERIIDPTWNQKTWSVVQDHLNGHSSEYRQELHLRRKDGTYAWVLAAGRVISQLADGRPKRMVGIHLDITESKLAEMKIRNLSERYAAAISGTSDGLWDWNCKNEDCWFSERFWTLLGFPDAGPFPAANLNSLVDRLHSNEVNEIWEAIRQHQEEGQDFDHEYRLRHENGEYRWFRVRAATQFDSDGRPNRMAGSIQDIHDLKLTQSSLINANARALSASAAKSAFLANMSHEIRTPMTAILGYSDLLLQEINNELGKNSFREYVGTIRKNGEQLLDLINDILDISKIEAGKMSVECLPTHPDALINDVLSLMAVKAHAKGLKIDLSIEPSVPATIQTDPVRLRQILVNLIGNAIKFTEQGSVRLHVACSASEQRLYLTVEDTGIGMTPEQISRIFGAFEQADTTTTRKYGGSGLGLHICNRLAEMLGGTISIESQVGIGSKFTVSIATGFVSSNAANTCELSSRPQGVALLNHIIASNENHPLAGLRILLAEDGLDNQRLISHILRKAGAEVQIADNGTFVVGLLTNDGTLESSLIEPCPFDLLVTDMQMPEMDGYETARWLRARGSEMPILALTAHAMTEELELCIAAGCNAYATKPINKTLLINLCWEWANRTLTPT